MKLTDRQAHAILDYWKKTQSKDFTKKYIKSILAESLGSEPEVDIKIGKNKYDFCGSVRPADFKSNKYIFCINPSSTRFYLIYTKDFPLGIFMDTLKNKTYLGEKDYWLVKNNLFYYKDTYKGED